MQTPTGRSNGNGNGNFKNLHGAILSDLDNAFDPDAVSAATLENDDSLTGDGDGDDGGQDVDGLGAFDERSDLLGHKTGYRT